MVALAARLAACRRGISAVELALILPLFCLIIFGILNFSLVLWTQASLYFAAQAAARCASASPTVCGKPANAQLVENYAISQYYGQPLGDVQPFSYVPPSGTNCGHTVNALYPYRLSMPFFEKDLNLSASACFPAGGSTG
jgi:Flp pilus assembly protein TadG